MAPQKSLRPKMRAPALPMSPLFFFRILFYSKNGDFNKKLELNKLRFDLDIRIFLKKSVFEQKKL